MTKKLYLESELKRLELIFNNITIDDSNANQIPPLPDSQQYKYESVNVSDDHEVNKKLFKYEADGISNDHDVIKKDKSKPSEKILTPDEENIPVSKNYATTQNTSRRSKFKKLDLYSSSHDVGKSAAAAAVGKQTIANCTSGLNLPSFSEWQSFSSTSPSTNTKTPVKSTVWSKGSQSPVLSMNQIHQIELLEKEKDSINNIPKDIEPHHTMLKKSPNKKIKLKLSEFIERPERPASSTSSANLNCPWSSGKDAKSKVSFSEIQNEEALIKAQSNITHLNGNTTPWFVERKPRAESLEEIIREQSNQKKV